MLGDDVAREIGEVVLFEEPYDGVAIRLRSDGPVDGSAKVWDRREDVQRLAAGWGDDPPIPDLLDDAIWAATLLATVALLLLCIAVFARRLAKVRGDRS